MCIRCSSQHRQLRTKKDWLAALRRGGPGVINTSARHAPDRMLIWHLRLKSDISQDDVPCQDVILQVPNHLDHLRNQSKFSPNHSKSLKLIQFIIQNHLELIQNHLNHPTQLPLIPPDHPNYTFFFFKEKTRVRPSARFPRCRISTWRSSAVISPNADCSTMSSSMMMMIYHNRMVDL